MIINGEGGSGKSWLIDHLVKDVRCVFREQPKILSQRILLLAHQGTATFNIKGQTVFSALGVSSLSRSAFSAPYTSLTTQKNGPNKLKTLQQQYKDVYLVIIDEFSVISCRMLHWIDERMKEIWPLQRHLPFGGRDVIFTGDAAQLDPAVPYALSTPLLQVYNDVQRKERE
ncbi:hypothetical protein PHMEG_00013033 [Phytophthora megakarya]|uniref:ATP-dependent DNA helicase n=1 Tax=Phytophthora megakarya TaxID=4795 RepID=A0A225W7R4_9STRA|nr:hypothetical protein PHMEG_00013033 [Phytophthora megakarya]